MAFSAAGPAAAVHLTVDPPGAPARAVHLHHLDPVLLAQIAQADNAQQRLAQLLQVNVSRAGEAPDPSLPAVAGAYIVDGATLHFLPWFPFADGVLYLARFDPARLGLPAGPAQSLAFGQPLPAGAAPQVLAVYPALDRVPANLLRMYVQFSAPMRRGDAAAEISLRDPDGNEMPDTLYRAPVELWDPGMRCLTVLLDPGRLKRGVGPNRALGPPLTAGGQFALRIGAGMRDAAGRPLAQAHDQRYAISEAERSPVLVSEWALSVPAAGSRDPLALAFRRPLDWAMLAGALRVSVAGETVAGQGRPDQAGMRWLFTPDQPWQPGPYRIDVSAELEDPCGNDVYGPFDRTLPAAGTRAREPLTRLAFTLA